MRRATVLLIKEQVAFEGKSNRAEAEVKRLRWRRMVDDAELCKVTRRLMLALMLF